MSLDGQNRQFVRAGLDGAYLFEHVVAGDYIVTAYLDGYLSAFDELTLTAADTTLAQLYERIVAAQGSLHVGAEGTQESQVLLERGAGVSGRVTYSDGAPAVGVVLELQDAAAPAPRQGVSPIQFGDIARSEFVHQPLETDDRGYFRISGIRPATYRIAAEESEKSLVQMSDFLIRSILGAIRYYTNDTIHPGLAKTYTLEGGKELSGLEIRIPLDGFHSVEGRVVAQDGRPITSAEVTVTETSDPSLFFLRAVSEGAFRFDRLPPGTYRLSARYGNIAPAGGEVTASFGSGSTTFTVKETDVTGVTLTLPEVATPTIPR